VTNGLLIGTKICDLEVTLNDPLAMFAHYFTQYGSFQRRCIKLLDPHCQQ